MSIYIKILRAEFNFQPVQQVCIQVKTQKTTLSTNFTSQGSFAWEYKMLCSTRELRLCFEVLQEIDSTKSQIIFSKTIHYPFFELIENQQTQQILNISDEYQNWCKLHLGILYNNKKKYIGPIIFYEGKNYLHHVNEQKGLIQFKNQAFFPINKLLQCCNQRENDKNYTIIP